MYKVRNFYFLLTVMNAGDFLVFDTKKKKERKQNKVLYFFFFLMKIK